MRKTFAAALVGAAAFSVLSVAPASASCTWAPDPVLGCSPCHVAGQAYDAADDATGGKLPSIECVA